MSQWTHINGSIRIDSLRHLTNLGVPPNTGNLLPAVPQSVQDIKDILGPMSRYVEGTDPEQWKKDWNDCTLPMGSEGSLEYEVVEQPEKSMMAAFTVVIFGDLRDFPDEDVNTVESIVQWFNEVCDKFMVRQATLEIEVEGGQTLIVLYTQSKNVVTRQLGPKRHSTS